MPPRKLKVKKPMEEVKLETPVENPKPKLFEFEIKRTPTDLEIWAKSEPLEGLFKSWANNRTLSGPETRQEWLEPFTKVHKVTTLPQIGQVWATARWGDPPYDPTYGVNLRYLMPVGLGSDVGLTIKIGLPYSRQAIQDLQKRLHTDVSAILAEFGRKITARGSITARDLKKDM
jgi:hypothetical protein